MGWAKEHRGQPIHHRADNAVYLDYCCLQLVVEAVLNVLYQVCCISHDGGEHLVVHN